MSTLKRLLTIAGGGIVGIVLLVLGCKEFFESKSLQSKGKAVDAEVTDSEERSGRRGRRKYYVSVAFKTEKGEAITSRSLVSKSIYDEASKARKINVTYLPSKPAVHRIGSEVSAEYFNILFGVAIIGFTGFSVIRGGGGEE